MNNSKPIHQHFLKLKEDERIATLLEALGETLEFFFVGGCVRDAFLGRVSSDIDLASKLPPEALKELLESKNIRTIDTGLKHQTISALTVRGQSPLEITTFRSAGMSPEGGHRISSTIEEDLAYRDFTINAMAISARSGELIDPFGGQQDIENKTLRAIPPASDRFAEDPLRVLRLIRFSAVLGFTIEVDTFDAARPFVPLLKNTAVERTREELVKILISDRPKQGFLDMDRLGVLELILPEVKEFIGYEQNQFHKADLFDHTLEVVEGIDPDPILRLSALLHDVGKPRTLTVSENGDRHFYRHEYVGIDIAKGILERLKFSSKDIKDICLLVQTHMRPIEAGDSGLRRLLRDTGELFPKWRKLKKADASACKIDEELIAERLEEFDKRVVEIKEQADTHPFSNLAINGRDLMALGIPEGRRIGVVLESLMERVLEDPGLNTREGLLRMVKEHEEL